MYGLYKYGEQFIFGGFIMASAGKKLQKVHECCSRIGRNSGIGPLTPLFRGSAIPTCGL